MYVLVTSFENPRRRSSKGRRSPNASYTHAHLQKQQPTTGAPVPSPRAPTSVCVSEFLPPLCSMRGTSSSSSSRRKAPKSPTPATASHPVAAAKDRDDALDPLRSTRKPTTAWGSFTAPVPAATSSRIHGDPAELRREAKAAPKNAAGASSGAPAAKSTAKPVRKAAAELLPVPATSRVSTTAIRPSNVVVVTQDHGAHHQGRIHTAISNIDVEASIPRTSRTSTSRSVAEQHAFLYSPLAADSVAPRRAKTAGPRDIGAEPTPLAAESASILSRSAAKSATGQRKQQQATGRYSDMGEALAENQRQVTEILDTISKNEEDTTTVVRYRSAYRACTSGY